MVNRQEEDEVQQAGVDGRQHEIDATTTGRREEPAVCIIDRLGDRCEGQPDQPGHDLIPAGAVDQLDRRCGGQGQAKGDLAMETATSDIRGVEFTPSSDGDSPVLPGLLDQIPEGEGIGSVTADDAHDTRRCHTAILDRQATPIIPIRKNWRPWKEDCPAALTIVTRTNGVPMAHPRSPDRRNPHPRRPHEPLQRPRHRRVRPRGMRPTGKGELTPHARIAQ